MGACLTTQLRLWPGFRLSRASLRPSLLNLKTRAFDSSMKARLSERRTRSLYALSLPSSSSSSMIMSARSSSAAVTYWKSSR